MRISTRCLIGAVASASLAFGSTVAAASTAAPPSTGVNAWQALSVLNGGASAIAFCGAATAARLRTGCVLPQVDAGPVPNQAAQAPVIDLPIPAPLPGAAAPFSVNVLLLALGALAVAALGYLVIGGGGNGSAPNSPV